MQWTIAAVAVFIILALAWNFYTPFREWIRASWVKSTVRLEVVGAAALEYFGALTDTLQAIEPHLPAWVDQNMWMLLLAYGLYARQKTKGPVK